MIRIVIADDHDMVRKGLSALISSRPEFKIIGEAGDGVQLLELVEKLSPDVVLSDISMPNMNGIEAARILKQRHPELPVIIISVHTSSTMVIQALRSGAAAYVAKNDPIESVFQAIKRAASGQRFLSELVSNQIIDAVVVGINLSEDASQSLSEREREILMMIIEGHTNGEIAKRLVISPRTVDTHRTNMMRKLGLTSQMDILLYAIRNHLIPVDQA